MTCHCLKHTSLCLCYTFFKYACEYLIPLRQWIVESVPHLPLVDRSAQKSNGGRYAYNGWGIDIQITSSNWSVHRSHVVGCLAVHLFGDGLLFPALCSSWGKIWGSHHVLRSRRIRKWLSCCLLVELWVQRKCAVDLKMGGWAWWVNR